MGDVKKEVLDELNAELEGLPVPVAVSKLILKIWDLLNQNYDEQTAAKKITEIIMDASGLPVPLMITKLVNHYLILRLSNIDFSKVDLEKGVNPDDIKG